MDVRKGSKNGLSRIYFKLDGRGIDVAGEISEIEEKGKIPRKLIQRQPNIYTCEFHSAIEKSLASAQGTKAGARKTIAAKTCR